MPSERGAQEFPNWLPRSVARYVAHTEEGVSIRELARRDGCHASTVMRQIRKLETMRDDPLVDAALERFRLNSSASADVGFGETDGCVSQMPKEDVLRSEGRRILSRLSQRGAILAVAKEMENAVVMYRDGTRAAVVTRHIAQAMALKGWIRCSMSGRVSRYTITPRGRTELGRMLANAENTAQSFGDGPIAFSAQRQRATSDNMTAMPRMRKARFSTADSPLTILARLRDKDGKMFLGSDLVMAGERLREDFELAQMAPVESTKWKRFLQAPGELSYEAQGKAENSAETARRRVATVFGELGPGLSDIALRCCCYLEGLEVVEKRLGWSARSGKIVLRIALTRLRDHYRAEAGGAGDYIG
ncbi:DUF6456 domain-containing protein [Shimia marina]|uniref:DUF6456 domain-containing protein n=1 Tax=Shimia marina TaxID=321267 RepID=A0A0P1ESQ9_9RHOB|nr:DUF6456 domain-containing protein [Shimia marina]CUH53391.1 hypothetical protein SHM7688_02845 [Shimia marina]SFD78106.1 hypothetical protein SAMN04488037_102427 [Shimia marina]